MNKTLKLNSVDWKEFKINDLFERIEKGKCKNTNEETKQSINGVSFLSATLNNNGVSGFVEPNSLLQKGNCIMFVNQGDGGAGYSVYKREDFISTTSNSFGYAKWINKYTGLFVASILCRFKEKYTFGYGRTENRLRKDKVFLPIDSKGQPNWEFMEDYMRQIEKEKIQKAIKYYEYKIKDLKNNIIKHKFNLNNIEWKDFKIREFFEVSGTTTTHPSQLKPNGKTPRITCASTNNALDNTYANSPTEKGKVLTVDSATVGYVSYQENDFIATDHVEKIWIKNNKTMNRYIGLFLKQCIDNSVLSKYEYGYKFSQIRIKKQIINLPIDSKGQPHWEFMENFMREIEYKKLNLYLDYIKKTKINL